MKSFSQFIVEKTNKEESHYINKKGVVTLLHAIGEKKRHHPRIKGKKKKLKENDESWRDNHYSDADENVGEVTSLWGGKGLNEEEFNEATALSERLAKNHKDMSEEHAKEIRKYTKGSSVINRSLINNHKEGKDRWSDLPDYKDQLEKTHRAIMDNARPAGRDVHLFSGTPHDFGAMARQSKDGIIHSPAHISASHHIGVGRHFAHTNMPDGHDGKEAHMIKVHVKGHQKILHVSDHSDYPAEHESIIPAGAKLKYSHSSEHYYRHDPDGQTPQKRKMHIHHFTIQDRWIK